MPDAAYSKTVEYIFDAVLDDRLTNHALQAVAEHVGASGAGCAVVNKFTGRVSWAAWSGILDGKPADYVSHYNKIDPWQSDLVRLGLSIPIVHPLPSEIEHV